MRGKRRYPPGKKGKGSDAGDHGETRDPLSYGYEHFRKLIENALDLVAVLGADGTIIYMSPSVRTLLGYEAEEMSGENILSFTHPEDSERTRSALAIAAGRPGVTRYFELRVRHRDGSWRLHEASAYNLLDDPAVGGLVINSRDITARKQAERLMEIQRDLGVRLGATADPSEALSASLEAVLEATGLDSGGIYVLDDETGGLRLAHHRGLSDAFVESVMYYDATSPRTALVKAGEAMYMSYEELPVPKDMVQIEEGLKATAVVPIMHEGFAIGCVNVASHDMTDIPAATRSILEVMLAQIGQILARIYLDAVVRESEGRYRLLHDYAGEAIFIYDRNLHLVSVNRAALEKIGYDEEEILGRNVFELGILHPDDFAKVGGNIEKLFAGESPVRDRVRFVAKDGSVLLLDINSADIFDDEGDVIAVTNIALDVTEQVKAEEALRESERYFRALIENSTDIITILDAAGAIVYESPSLQQFLGYRPEELIGGNVFDYLHPDDAPLALEAFREGIGIPGNASYMEVRFRHKDGSWRWFGGTGSNLLDDPVVRGILLNSQDITERVEAERALVESRRAQAALMSNLPGMAYRCRVDRDWSMDFVSEGCLELTGYRAEELTGEPAVTFGSHLIRPDYRDYVWDGVREALEANRPYELTYPITTRQGTEKWVWEQGRAVFSPQGEVLAIEGFIADITDRKRAEEVLRIQRDLAFTLSGESDLGGMLEESLQAILDASGLDSGAVYLVDEETGALELAFSLGFSGDFVARVKHFDAASTPAEVVAESRAVYDRTSVSDYAMADLLETEGIKSIYIVPLLHEGRAVGSVNVSSHTHEDIPQRTREIVDILAGQIGQALVRVRLVSALRGSEKYFRALIEESSDIITVLDAAGTIRYISPSIERILGYGQEEYLDRNMEDAMALIHPEDVGVITGTFFEYVRDPDVSSNTLEFRVRHKDGSWRVMQAAGNNLLDDPLVGGVIINWRDITESRQAERLTRAQLGLAVRMNETIGLDEILGESMRAVLEVTGLESGSIFLVDPETGGFDLAWTTGHSEEFTDKVRHFTADSPNGMMMGAGMPIYRGYGEPLQHESGLRAREGLRAVAIVPMLSEGKVIGSVCAASYILDGVDEHTRTAIEVLVGQISQAVVRARLISALRESEEELRRLGQAVEQAIDGVAVSDLAGRLLYVNRAWAEMHGYRVDELLGQRIGILHNEEQMRDVVDPFNRVVIEKGSNQGEIDHVRKDGSVFPTLMTTTLFRDLEGEPRGLIGIARDITERRRAEQALRESEERFRLLAENAKDLVYRIRMAPERRFEYVSPSATEITGYTPEEHYSDPDLGFKMVHPDDRHLLEAAAKGDLEPQAPLQFRWVRKDGSIVWTEQKNTLIFDEAGEVVAIEGIARDITDRKRAEEVLRESEESYRVTFESTGTAMGVIEADGTISATNSEFEKLVGYAKEDVEGKSRYWEFVHKDDLRMAKSYALRIARQELATPFQYECRLRHRDGGILQVLVNVNFLPGMEKSVVSIIDITDRKRAEEVLRESEEQYRATFETTGTAMFLVDEDAILSGANREMEKVFGYSREEVVGKMRYMRLVMPEDVDKVKRMSIMILRGEIEGPIQYEIKARHKTGRPIDALISVNILPGTGKSVVSLIDISEKKAYERQLEENAEQMRDFLDIAAHELRHPATLLKGYAVTLEKRGEDIGKEDWYASMQGIEAGADRLIYVVEELLDASRLQRGRFAISKEEVPVGGIVLRAVEEMRMRGAGRDISLDLPDDLDTAYADPERLIRLFIILLDNAVKYSPPGSLVELKGERRAGEVFFSVLDRGMGIPLEDRERVFDRFYQVGSALHHSGPGLGLGLYIGKRIVEAHGGRIWYEPREGGGSVFTFSMPAR
jgi:PAS domain S-box-containing protein